MTQHEESGNKVTLMWVLVDDVLHPVADFADLRPRQRPDARCPLCHASVILKLGKKKVHHAAHQAKSRCPARKPETALHQNVKFYLAQQLKLAASLQINEPCLGFDGQWSVCPARRTSVFADHWDDVQVEYALDPLRPDIMLLIAGQPLAAIEVWVSHRVEDPKADLLQQMGIPWIEVEGTESIYTNQTAWTPEQPLHVVRHSAAGRCPSCQAYQEQFERASQARLDRIEEARLALAAEESVAQRIAEFVQQAYPESLEQDEPDAPIEDAPAEDVPAETERASSRTVAARARRAARENQSNRRLTHFRVVDIYYPSSTLSKRRLFYLGERVDGLGLALAYYLAEEDEVLVEVPAPLNEHGRRRLRDHVSERLEKYRQQGLICDSASGTWFDLSITRPPQRDDKLWPRRYQFGPNGWYMPDYMRDAKWFGDDQAQARLEQAQRLRDAEADWWAARIKPAQYPPRTVEP